MVPVQLLMAAMLVQLQNARVATPSPQLRLLLLQMGVRAGARGARAERPLPPPAAAAAGLVRAVLPPLAAARAARAALPAAQMNPLLIATAALVQPMTPPS